MNISLITNDKEHEEAMNKLDSFMDIENPSEKDLNDMKLLAMVIEEYEDKRWPIPSKLDPVDYIQFIMEQKGLRPVDVKEYFGGNTSRFYEIINKKRNLSLNMIKKLHEGLGIPYDCLIA